MSETIFAFENILTNFVAEIFLRLNLIRIDYLMNVKTPKHFNYEHARKV